MEKLLDRRRSPILIGCVGTPPPVCCGLSTPRVSLALRTALLLNDKPMWIIEDCCTIVRGCVDPREKSVIVPGLSGFLKRAQDSISSHGGFALMSEPQPIGGKRIWLMFHDLRSCVDTGGHRYCPHVFRAVKIRGIHESGMGSYLPRVGRNCPPLTGLYSPRTVLWISNQSAGSQPDKGFFAVQGGVDPRKLVFLRRLMESLDMWNDLWTGDGTPHPPEVELAQHTNHGQSYNRPVGLEFPHRAERYQPG